MPTKPTTQTNFVGSGRVHTTVIFPKTGVGVGTCADIRKRLTPQQAEYLWMRGQHRLRHARAVMLFQAKSKHQRLKAILKAVGFSIN